MSGSQLFASKYRLMSVLGSERKASDRTQVTISESLSGMLSVITGRMSPLSGVTLSAVSMASYGGVTKCSSHGAESRSQLFSKVFFFFFCLHFRARWGTEPYVALHEIYICLPVAALVFLPSLPLQLSPKLRDRDIHLVYIIFYNKTRLAYTVQWGTQGLHVHET
jgi:hypothetical protein